jgi:hypothetical protein
MKDRYKWNYVKGYKWNYVKGNRLYPCGVPENRKYILYHKEHKPDEKCVFIYDAEHLKEYIVYETFPDTKDKDGYIAFRYRWFKSIIAALAVFGEL